jgi:hypothetical protein
LLVDFPADEVALPIEVVVDLAVDRDEFLKRLCPAELEHRRLSSSKRLMRILGPIVLPATDLPAFEVAERPYRRAVGAQSVGDDDLRPAVALLSFLRNFKALALSRLLLTMNSITSPS